MCLFCKAQWTHPMKIAFSTPNTNAALAKKIRDSLPECETEMNNDWFKCHDTAMDRRWSFSIIIELHTFEFS